MPKPRLTTEYERLEDELIETFLAGHHEWRSDLPYPESHSDMSGGMRALLRMFDIKRRPLALPMKHFIAEHEQGCDCRTCSS